MPPVSLNRTVGTNTYLRRPLSFHFVALFRVHRWRRRRPRLLVPVPYRARVAAGRMRGRRTHFRFQLLNVVLLQKTAVTTHKTLQTCRYQEVEVRVDVFQFRTKGYVLAAADAGEYSFSVAFLFDVEDCREFDVPYSPDSRHVVIQMFREGFRVLLEVDAFQPVVDGVVLVAVVIVVVGGLVADFVRQMFTRVHYGAALGFAGDTHLYQVAFLEHPVLKIKTLHRRKSQWENLPES